ncbi:hypothetical protein MCOR25_006393 [Pyricularia grisea]|uniref:Uncharacterized protein n=1 Tax=Pyricularia grisea TaxID=148305 RepID=A0A6P8B292_PYRGI|nr:uncharacterized protein PgNI_07853 [Pyricularia grisea]KAI6361775.1 hypothetical protein MCOR25_006393 [Pyricularia grisea]TLD09020.1 hypothetical protein PgNI_07853 [Pyricularia grisea]
MVALKPLILLGLVANAAAAGHGVQHADAMHARQDYGNGSKGKGEGSKCGKLNFVFTGIPWNHPAIKASGRDPAMVEAAIKYDIQTIVQAGYNIKAILVGPEDPISDIAEELDNVPGVKDWTATGVGYGLRGSNATTLTLRFTDVIELFREKQPEAPILFNYSPVTSLWAIQQKFPLPAGTNCSAEGKPGKDYGIAIHCSACKSTN